MDNEALVDELVATSRALMSLAARALDDVDLSLPQFRSLVVLGERGPLSTTELADAVGVHQSTATRGTDRLARLGLVTRVRDHVDRRRVVITVTPRGARMVAEVMARRRAAVQQVVQRMDVVDVAAFVDALRAFSTAAAGDARVLAAVH